jgi:hypothetical protein
MRGPEWFTLKLVYCHLTILIGLHFVVSTNLDKANPKLRKLIRSHVMLGKNRGKMRPTLLRQKKEIQDSSPSSSDMSSMDNNLPEQGLILDPALAEVSHPVFHTRVPPKFGYYATGISLADAVDPNAIEAIIKCRFL